MVHRALSDKTYLSLGLLSPLNSFHNIISEPTRQLALLDPIIVHEDISTLSQGMFQVPNEISDHCATYVHIPFEYPLHDTFTRNVWIYKDANYELFNKKIYDFDWSCLHQGNVNKASSLFTNILLNLLTCAYLVKLLQFMKTTNHGKILK